MEVKRGDLGAHKATINAILVEICHAPNYMALVRDTSACITSCGSPPLARTVVSDLDNTEVALRLPIPNAESPRFWIALHECWDSVGKHKLHFKDCGIRVYTGAMDEQPIQILRLEWVAPTTDATGNKLYHGGRAGHPHWHIDRSSFVGLQEHYRALETLTSPSSNYDELEQFTAETTPFVEIQATSPYDCSWMSKLHLPAQARWTEALWNGTSVPGPHQNEPNHIRELDAWWSGALRYIASELIRAN